MKALEDIIQQYIEAYNSFAIPKMLTLFDEDCIFENICNAGESMKCLGVKELEHSARNSAKLFSSRHQTVTNFITEKNKAAIQVDYHGIVAIDLPNGLKAGQEINLKGASFFEFENGKIKKLIDIS